MKPALYFNIAGELEALLDAYDRDRLVVPSPVAMGMWEWGWTKSAEIWNGRLAMLAVFSILILEVMTGQSILKSMMMER
jgi:ferrochelatase